MSNLFRELRIAVRYLLKSPGFAITAVLMLALGIGATTAIFSIVEGVLLRPLPFPEPNRLVDLSDILEGANIPQAGDDGIGVTAPDIVNYSRDTQSFSSLGGYGLTGFELSGIGEPAMVSAARMSSGVLPALDVQPLMGRFFTQQEDEQHQQVALLSYETWRKRFHGDPGILGQKILLDRKPYVVIGVMPRNFEFPLVPGHINRSELWVPFSPTAQELTTGSASWSFQMVGRLKPGVTPEQALTDAKRVADNTVRNYPSFMAGLKMHPVIRSLQYLTVKNARPLIRTLFLAVTVVLLIVCANLAGLLLVRAIRRRKEIAVRLALGAQAAVLLRQAVLESLVLSITGGVLGLCLAVVALRTGIRLLPETLPRVNEIGINWVVAAFALLLALATGLICGLAPAFAAMRTKVNDTLKEGGRTGSAGAGHARLRSALVIAEIAVALILLTASGLLLRSFQKMRDVSLGYSPEHTLTASYSLPQKQYTTQAAVDQFNQELLRRLQALPGAKAAAVTSLLPASGNNNDEAILPEGYMPPKDTYDLATTAQIQGDYFAAMGIPLLQGRAFTPDDDSQNSQLVVVVNHKLAQQSWPGQNPIGKRMRVGLPNMVTPWMVVVGEVADVRLGSPDVAPVQQFFVPIDQAERDIGSLASPTDLNGNGGYITLRTAMPPEQMENALRAMVRSIDPQLPLNQVQAMTQALSESEAPRRFNTFVISAFAAAAVLLAVLGIYSVIAFTVALRVQEMAIRMALGSQRSGIVALVLASGAKLAAIGCVLGLLGALASSRLLQTLLFGVSPFDPLTLALAVIAVLLLVLVASLIPARRAAAINPMRALREE
jgi:predicted permease